MKIYKKENVNGRQIYCIMYWDYDMRSIQVGDRMLMFIQAAGLGNCFIHPNWQDMIKGIEAQFLSFLNHEPYSMEVPSVDDIISYIGKLVETEKLAYSSSGY